MKNHTIMLLNGLLLIVIGFVSYFDSEVKSFTALIAPIAGIILAALSFPTKKDNHTAAHIGVILTLLLALSLIVPIMRTGSTYAIIMAAASFLAFILYVMSFIKRKKDREANI